MHSQAAKDAEIFQGPYFIVIMICAKFGPHRNALQTAYHRNPKPESADNVIVCQKVALRMVLYVITTCRLMVFYKYNFCFKSYPAFTDDKESVTIGPLSHDIVPSFIGCLQRECMRYTAYNVTSYLKISIVSYK